MLKEILLREDVVKSINDNLDSILTLIPELEYEIGFDQKHPHHHLDVWNHTLLALSMSKCNYITRTALLLHDIGKPFSYQEKDVRHFKGHPEKSSEMAKSILKRLNYPKEEINLICWLIKYHDTKIDTNLINNDYYNYRLLYEIQRCDALAHHPEKQEKRKAYLNSLDPYFKKIELYRLCNKEEIDILLKNKNFEELGSKMKNNEKKNNFDYREDTKYIHFFKDKDNILYLNCSKGKYVCSYLIPENIVNAYSGIGKYLDFMFFRNIVEIEEVAIPITLMDYNYLDSVEKLIDDYDIGLEYKTEKITVKSLKKENK